MKIAIIGGGPAGLMAASKINCEVHLFDKNSSVGKKLLLTGNGKCNYWNDDTNINHFHSNNVELLNKFITNNNLELVYNYLSNLGIVPYIKNGYYYPYSLKANSIKSLLIQKCNNVIFHNNTDIINIEYKNNKYIIDNIEFDKLVIATGSKANPKTGSTGNGYSLASMFGHSINSINPSLVQLITNTGLEDKWANFRCLASVSHLENNKIVKTEEGEIQFTNYGLSGICIFNLSRDIRIGLNKKLNEEVLINFVPWCSNIIEYLDTLNKRLNSSNIIELCDGFIDYKLFNILIKKCNINPNSKWDSLSDADKKEFAMILTSFEVPVIDTKSFDNAQTCSGGIPLTEVDLITFESLKKPNLYFCGEILDIDGDCGGYNLMSAFLTGYLVGEAIND